MNDAHLSDDAVTLPKVLRDNGFATVRADRTRRLYAVETKPLADIDQWLQSFRRLWAPHLDALETELARGRRDRRIAEQVSAEPPHPDTQARTTQKRER